MVVLEDVKGAHPPPARTVTVEIGGLDAHPRMVIMGPGSVLEIKNTGKVTPRVLDPRTTAVMPVEPLTPGAARRVKFDAAGRLPVRDAEYPHIVISVIVVDSPSTSTARREGQLLDRRRARRQGELKVWTRGPGPPSRTSTPVKKKS